MDCPKCTGTLVCEQYGEDIKVHRCDMCAGLWCKPASLRAMKNTWMSEAVLDVGDPRIGSSLNHLQSVSCPEGHGLLTRKRDANQRHIEFEVCPECHGIFFDAGEFTDLKHETLLDKLRTLFFPSPRQGSEDDALPSPDAD